MLTFKERAINPEPIDPMQAHWHGDEMALVVEG